MEMHQIRYFLAVAETLNFTRAALACHVAQPSLSRAIRKLEDELGGNLFRRERSRTHLTDLGRDMHPWLRQAFDSAEAAKAQAAGYKAAAHAPLRIGLSLTVNLDLIAPMLTELARALPGLELHVVRAPGTEVIEALEAGDHEIGIAADIDAGWERLDRWPLFEERFVLLAPTGWSRPVPGLADIDDDLVIARPYCETLAVQHSAAAAEDAAHRNRHEVWNDDDAAVLAGCGMGVAIVPASSARQLAASLVATEAPELTRTVRVYAVVGRQRSRAASGLLKLLRAADWSSVVPH